MFWDSRSQQYDKAVQKHDSQYDKMIDATITLLTGSDVMLDFACASGEFSLELAAHTQHVHG